MLLGCIADDFTGASDLANTLSKNGMATALFNGIPTTDAPPSDAGVIALKTRSVAIGVAVEESLKALGWLLEQGCEQIFFKYCSTFDSTEEGNIGPVAEALLAHLGEHQAVVCPSFPENGRTLYQGHLFVGGVLLNESGMENHPVNPMTDANIVRWLDRQCDAQVALVNHDVVRSGASAIEKALATSSAENNRLVVIDATTDDDLRSIGEAVRSHRLVTGGSGVAMGLPANFRATGKLSASRPRQPGVSGPAIVLSGSCSKMSLRQIHHFLEKNPGLAVRADDVVTGAITPGDALAFAIQHRDQTVAIYSSADPAAVTSAQNRHGRESVASSIEGFFGNLSVLLAEAGFARFVVGGGETSGAVSKALNVQQFVIGSEIDPGVPALYDFSGEKSIGLALKSGNFGSLGFYEKAIATLAGES